MKVQPLPVEIALVPTRGAPSYGSLEEVEAAIHDLTDDDHAKLMLIAQSFCNSRRLAPSVMEAGELLSEAFLKTLQLEKKWNKRVSMMKHLDRAMENISGHTVSKRLNILSFADGLNPPSPPKGEEPQVNSAEDDLVQREESERLLTKAFGADTKAASILILRSQGFEAAEIQVRLQLNALQYETIAKRMRRKIAIFITTK